MTRSGIADYPGLTMVTVSRTLTRFKSEGLLDMPSAFDLVIPGLVPLAIAAGMVP